jgi:hypothetical protein
MASTNLNYSIPHYRIDPLDLITPSSGSTGTEIYKRKNTEQQGLLNKWLDGIKQAKQTAASKYASRDDLDSSKVVNTQFKSQPDYGKSKAVIDLLTFVAKNRTQDQSTSIFKGILEMVLETDTEYPLSLRTAMSGLQLASELATISTDMDYYASPNDTLTFEIFLDGKRATITQEGRISVVISRKGSIPKAQKFPNTSEGIESLKEYIKAF